MSQIKKIAVIGTGVIGTGWIIRCLAHNKIVHAYDKDIKLKKNLITEIKRTWPYVKKLFNKKTINLKNFKYFTSIEEALREVDFIQECASENYALKTKLMSSIGKYSKPNAILKKGRLCKIKKCKGSWCKVSVGNFNGWVQKESLWGLL